MPMAPALSMRGGWHRRKAPRDKGDDPSGVPAIPQRKLAGTEVPAKFEQGVFTSGRRKGPQTLFPGTSPGNRTGVNRRRRNSVKAVCTNWRALTTRNFYWLVCKNRNALGIAAEN